MRGLGKQTTSFIRKALFFVFILMIVWILPIPLTHEPHTSFSSHTFGVNFSEFSPAFAAFEDEFLQKFIEDIQQRERTEDLQIKGEQDPEIFSKENQNSSQPLVQHPKTPTPGKIQDPPFETFRTDRLLQSFDGQIRIKDIPNLSTTSSLQKNSKSFQSGKLGFGSLIHLESKKVKKQFASTGKFSWNKEKAKPNPLEQDFRVSQSFITDKDHKPYKIQGEISLKEGLPFLGSMEVSWVMNNSVFRSGAINTSNATYEIHVDQPVGDIVVSVYDENNSLIGEGSMDLGYLSENPSGSRNIEVFPIDWDHGGQAIHGLFLDSKNKPLSGVNISLYAFNESTTTDPNGNFGFPNWKKTGSRSIALASKSGYHDSIFLMDSRQLATVPLFPLSHIQSFFSYLQTQGISPKQNGGIIYGSLLGNSEKSGYKISIEGQSAIYFSPLGFADINAHTTSSNGLFSFVGLENGDYRIVLEKQGELVDEKWVVVESSKISPVLFNPRQTRHPGFFNSTDSKQEFLFAQRLDFFDNNDSAPSKHRDLSEISTLQPSAMNSKSHPRRQNPDATDQLSVEIPQISEKLHTLAQQHRMQIHDGLIFGFVDSAENYRASLIEEAAGKIIYFNKEAVKIDPTDEIPFGFILGGFPRGLNSLAIESKKTSMVLTTDLVFSDHQSISLVHMEVFPVEKL